MAAIRDQSSPEREADRVIPLVLSNSSISSWLTCRYKWFLENVWRLKSEPSVPMLLGSAVHIGAAEFHWTGSPEKAKAATSEYLSDNWPSDPDETPEVVAADAQSMLDTYIREVAPTFSPAMVEAPFVIEVNGIPFSGIIDAATEDDLYDLKTTSGKTIAGRKPSFRPDDHRQQLTGYGLGLLHLTGKRPKHSYLNVLKRTGKYQRYEVEPDEREFQDVLGLVSDGILSGDFAPTGRDTNKCQWCSFKNRCQFSTTRVDG